MFCSAQQNALVSVGGIVMSLPPTFCALAKRVTYATRVVQRNAFVVRGAPQSPRHAMHTVSQQAGAGEL